MEIPGEIYDSKQLQTWGNALAKEVERLRVLLRTTQSELASAEERLNLVNRLLELDGNSLSVPEATRSGDSQDPQTVEIQMIPSSSAELEDAVETILTESGSPLHIAEIREKLIAMGVRIPGRGDDANIIVRIRRFDDRFTRTGRGIYALASWGLPSVDTARKVRTAKKATKR